MTDSKSPSGSPSRQHSKELLLALYTTMVRIQESDKAIQRALSAGELQFQYYPAGGQEAIPAGIAPHLTSEDYLYGDRKSVV